MRYPGVDVIRLGAALIVVLYHFGYVAGSNGILSYWASAGWVGVPVFFVISGFVIALSAEGRTAREFAVNRLLRLYPAAWICASLTLIIAGGTTSQYLRSITLSPIGPWIDDVYWTLAVELVFYALVFVVMRARGSLAALGVTLGIYSSMFWTLKVFNWLSGSPHDLSAIENYTGFLLLLHDGIFFAIGMCLRKKRFWFAGAFSVVGMVAVLARSQAITEAGVAPFYVPALVWLVALGLVVLFTLKPAQWSARTIGLMTYPLYLVHNEVGRVIQGQFGFTAALLSVLLLALLVLPAERWIRAFLIARPKERALVNQPL